MQVTVLAMPATILTGYFGQNFDDMVELRTADGGYGIRTFWVGLGIATFVMVVLMWRLRFCRMLSF